ncbi:hypothetical protein VF04_37940, partial [Nostoc linckia z7]
EENNKHKKRSLISKKPENYSKPRKGREQQTQEAIANFKKARELFQAEENNEMVEQIDGLIKKIEASGE